MRICLFTGGSSSGPVINAIRVLGVHCIHAIVPASDSGGKSGQLSFPTGSPITSDATTVSTLLASHSMSPEVLQLLDARVVGEMFGSISGIRLASVIAYAARTGMGLSVQGAIDVFGSLIGVGREDRVVIVSEGYVHIQAHHKSGRVTSGESAIDMPYDDLGKLVGWRLDDPINSLVYDGVVSTNPDCIESIDSSDLIVFSPGSFWTSIAPILIMPDIAREVRLCQQSGKKVVVVTPAFTETGVTHFQTSNDVLDAYIAILGEGVVTDAIVNNGVPSGMTQAYLDHGQRPIALGESGQYRGVKIRHGVYVSSEGYGHIPGGPKYVRHSPEALAASLSLIMKL